MYHTIEFTADMVADLIVSRKHALERVRIRRGDRIRAQIRPYVAETEGGPVEVADLFLEDGTATRGIPYGAFTFVD